MSGVVCSNDGDTHNSPCEQLEAKYPILFERFCLRTDSGGPGRYRGGLGTEQVVRALAPITVDVQAERMHCAPWGIRGGMAGKGNDVTTRVDGWAHRVLRTPFIERLLATGPLLDLPRAFANAVRFQRVSGARWSDLIREALAMRKNQELSWAQTLMAPNTPMLLHASMVKGDLRSGVMAGGQVAGLLEDLPSCKELIERIMAEADATLRRLEGKGSV